MAEEKQEIRFNTTKFGEVSIKAHEVLRFPRGLIGFETVREFVILPNPSGGPFQWLQAVGAEELAFVVCDPTMFKPNYRISIHKSELEEIELEEISRGLVLVIVVIPKGGSYKDMTANLKGPIIINTVGRLAKQLVLSSDEYEVKHRIFDDGEGDD